MANAGDIVARLRLENDDFRRGAEAAKHDMDQMSAKAQEASASISTIQKISGAAFAGVTATIGTSVAMAANFEQGMARVRGITGATDDEFAALEYTARSLGRSTRFTTQQAAEGMQYLAMAGFDTNQIISSMPGVLNLASAAQLDLGASSDIVSNIMTGFGLSADETGRAVDVLVETMTSANTDLPQLGHAMKFVAPVASALGLDIEETATAIAKMSDAGIQGGRAGTALRAALLSLANPTGQTIKAFEKLGIEVTTADGAMKPLPELIGHINGKLDGMTEAQRTQTVAQLVGREAASGFIALLEQGEDSLAKYAQGLRDSEGAAQQMADTQNNTVLGAFDAFKSALADIGISIGQEYLPAIRQLLDGATDMVRTFGELDPQLISMTLNFAAVSSGIALATTTIIKLGAAIRGLFIAMGPGGWLIVGLSLLAGAIVAHNIEAEKMAQVNLETANSLNDMHTELSEAASRYQELRTESKLTTDEFGELLDIRKEMASNPEAAALEALQERFDELSKKSGLTNEQLEEMLGLNQTIVDRAPQTVEAHSAQGEAIAGVNDKLQEYIDGLLTASETELELEKIKWAEQREKHLDKVRAATENINELESQALELSKYQGMSKDELWQLYQELANTQASYLSTEEEIAEAAKEQEIVKKLIDDGIVGTIDKLQGQIQKEKEILENSEQELAKGQEIDDLYSNIQLKKIGINETGERGVQIAEEQLESLRKQRDQLQEKISQEGDQHGILSEQLNVINDQIGAHESTLKLIGRETDIQSDLLSGESERERRIQATNSTLAEQERIHGNNTSAQNSTNSAIDEGTGKAREQTAELGKDVSKNVNVTDNGTIASLDERARRPVTKLVTFKETNSPNAGRSTNVSSMPRFQRHQGGTVERGAGAYGQTTPVNMLHSGGQAEEDVTQRFSSLLARSPMFNELDVRLLRNEMVLTESQQANLHRMIQAGQTGGSQPDNSPYFAQMVGLLGGIQTAIKQADSKGNVNLRRLGRDLEPYISDYQERGVERYERWTP